MNPSTTDTHAARLAVSAAYLTNRGAKRDHNEDACVFSRGWTSVDMTAPVEAQLAGDNPWLLAVLDGMGGRNAGERASQEVAATLAHCCGFAADDLRDTLQSLNHRLFELGRTNVQLSGMGASVAGLCHGPGGLFAFNVGDARVYRVQDKYLAQITRDDSVAQILVDAGQAEAGEIRDAKVHTVTQSLGGRFELASIEPHFYPVRIRASDRFLLCSDGLTDMVSLDDMEAIVACEADGTLALAVQKLFDAAMLAGGDDNITMIIADVRLCGYKTENPRDYGSDEKVRA